MPSGRQLFASCGDSIASNGGSKKKESLWAKRPSSRWTGTGNWPSGQNERSIRENRIKRFRNDGFRTFSTDAVKNLGRSLWRRTFARRASDHEAVVLIGSAIGFLSRASQVTRERPRVVHRWKLPFRSVCGADAP